MKRSGITAVEFLEQRALLSRIAAPHVHVSALQSGPHAASVAQGLEVTLTTDQAVYHRGQPVTITLTERNTGDQDVNVSVGPSIDGFNVTQNGRPVWTSNSGIQPMFLELKTLKPGESLVLSATWNGRGGGPFGPALSGSFMAHSQVPGSPAVGFRVLP